VGTGGGQTSRGLADGQNYTISEVFNPIPGTSYYEKARISSPSNVDGSGTGNGILLWKHRVSNGGQTFWEFVYPPEPTPSLTPGFSPSPTPSSSPSPTPSSSPSPTPTPTPTPSSSCELDGAKAWSSTGSISESGMFVIHGSEDASVLQNWVDFLNQPHPTRSGYIQDIILGTEIIQVTGEWQYTINGWYGNSQNGYKTKFLSNMSGIKRQYSYLGSTHGVSHPNDIPLCEDQQTTPTPTFTPTPSPTPSSSPSPTPSFSPTPTPSETSGTPALTPSPSPTPSSSPSPTPSFTPTPSFSPTPTPSETSGTPALTPSPTATVFPLQSLNVAVEIDSYMSAAVDFSRRGNVWVRGQPDQNAGGHYGAGRVLARRNDNGSWGSAVTVTEGSGTQGRGREVAVSTDGNMIACADNVLNWDGTVQNLSENLVVRTFKWSGSSWADAGTIDVSFGGSSSATKPAMRIVGNGTYRLAVAGYGSNRAGLEIHEYNGTSWSELTIDATQSELVTEFQTPGSITYGHESHQTKTVRLMLNHTGDYSKNMIDFSQDGNVLYYLGFNLTLTTAADDGTRFYESFSLRSFKWDSASNKFITGPNTDSNPSAAISVTTNVDGTRVAIAAKEESHVYIYDTNLSTNEATLYQNIEVNHIDGTALEVSSPAGAAYKKLKTSLSIDDAGEFLAVLTRGYTTAPFSIKTGLTCFTDKGGTTKFVSHSSKDFSQSNNQDDQGIIKLNDGPSDALGDVDRGIGISTLPPAGSGNVQGNTSDFVDRYIINDGSFGTF
jgi:hypothetical protein